MTRTSLRLSWLERVPTCTSVFPHTWGKALSASALDWIDQSQRRMQHVIVVWDAQYLSRLDELLKMGERERRSLREQVHAELVARRNAHRKLHASFIPNAHLRLRYRPLDVKPSDDFVDRDSEARELNDFSRYSRACIEGPPGIGKSSLARVVMQHAREEGFSDAVGVNKVRHRLAMISSIEEELDHAKEQFESVAVESKRLNDRKRLSYAKHRLAEIARLQGRYEEATGLNLESLSIKKKSGHVRGIAFTLLEQVRLCLETDSLDDAEQNAAQAIVLCAERGFRKEEGMAFFLRGLVERARGNETQQVSWLKKAQTVFSELGLDARVRMIEEQRLEELSRRD